MGGVGFVLETVDVDEVAAGVFVGERGRAVGHAVGVQAIGVADGHDAAIGIALAHDGAGQEARRIGLDDLEERLFIGGEA